MRILVTDGECRSALAVTRSLGRKGHDVLVAATAGSSIAAASRFCQRQFTVPEPLTGGDNYAAAIADIVDREKVEVLFPLTEQSICRLNLHRDRFEPEVALACAPDVKMDQVSDKAHLLREAIRLGVPVPETVFIGNRDEYFSQAAAIRNFPVVVKPFRSKIIDGDRILSAGVLYAENSAALTRLYQSNPVLHAPSMIQELIVGKGTGLFTLFDIDRHLALFSHQRLLEKPPRGGVSVLSESVPLDDAMVDDAKKLLASVGWEGLAMVEFKRDMRDGRAKLMEINGRAWGSMQLAISSGVDFPALYVDYCCRREAPREMPHYRVGQRLKWRLGMLDHLIIRLKSGNRIPVGGPEFASCWQVARELLKAGDPRVGNDVFDVGDLKPFWVELQAYASHLVRHRPANTLMSQGQRRRSNA